MENVKECLYYMINHILLILKDFYCVNEKIERFLGPVINPIWYRV